jgi:RNA polymerase sigma factor (sigma-70 family)
VRKTFAEQVAAARPRVTAVVARLVGDDAEDVVQEATLRAFLSLSQLRDADRFEAWLCGIALNVAKMRLRRAALHVRAVGSLAAVAHDGGGEREVLDAVRDAVELLPSGQRDAVLLHYVDGLSCDEVAELLGSTPGAVRVRLHRARAQLRRELAPHLSPAPTPEEEPMIEMTLDDVLVHVSEDDPQKLEDPRSAVVVLREKGGDRTLPIWVGSPEGAAMAFRLRGSEPMRPMTSDLLVELLRVTGGKVGRVAITELRENVFYGTIAVDGHEVDARPSDAINLAVRVGAPILVAEAVLDEVARGEHALPPEGERWTSLSAEMLAELHKPPSPK